MSVTLYDLVPHRGPSAPFFSPACIRARLALAHKGIAIQTQTVTYHDLRTVWKERLGVEKATAPFIERPDGTYLMDSFEIAKWLEEAYPDRPSLFLPLAPLPVNVSSLEFQAALDDLLQFKSLVNYDGLFRIFAPRFAPTFAKEDFDYWTSAEKMGPGRYKMLQEGDQDKAISDMKEQLQPLANLLSSTGDRFFASSSTPGFKDFLVLGPHRMLSSSPDGAALVAEVYSTESVMGQWVSRMYQYYSNGLLPVQARDPA